ncbi:hypothetical protein [Herbaspirillum sp. RV1423]|uniref:hypothetical protein n=1 Tax=Herbaspirillum sp. RV1423 TaxID=1443993 RepID=UPI0004BA64E3|nr:hypothetical protein [Herbaspirillum sp. RV1423]
MAPLDKHSLLLIIDERDDPAVARFIEVVDCTTRAEMISDPCTWTEAEKEAWDRGDWREFSTLRGYSQSEISDFAEYLELAEKLDHKYGENYSASISYLVQEHNGSLGL